MRAAPAYLILFSLLSSGLLFAQEHISESKMPITDNNKQTSINYPVKSAEKNLVSYTTPDQTTTELSNTINKINQPDPVKKAVLEKTEKIQTSVPRTTIDFF